jgi:heme exporter protein D
MMKFLAMGGYALYVWPSYALTALAVLLNILWARSALRTAQREARRRLGAARPAATMPYEVGP